MSIKLKRIIKPLLIVILLLTVAAYFLPQLLDKVVIHKLSKAALFSGPVSYQRTNPHTLVVRQIHYETLLADEVKAQIHIPMMIIEYTWSSLSQKRLEKMLCPRVEVSFAIQEYEVSAEKLAMLATQLRYLYLAPPAKQMAIDAIGIEVLNERKPQLKPLWAIGSFYSTSKVPTQYRVHLKMKSRGNFNSKITLQSQIVIGDNTLHLRIDDSSRISLESSSLSKNMSFDVHPKKIQMDLDLTNPQWTKIKSDIELTLHRLVEKNARNTQTLAHSEVKLQSQWIPEREQFKGTGQFQGEIITIKNHLTDREVKAENIMLNVDPIEYFQGIWNGSGRSQMTITQTDDPILSHLPFKIKSTFSIKDNLLKAHGKLLDKKNIFSGDFSLKHFIPQKTGQGQLYLKSNHFNKYPLIFNHLIHDIDPDLFFESGNLSAQGNIKWSHKHERWHVVANDDFHLDINKLSGRYKATTFKDLQGTVFFNSIVPLQSKPKQTLLLEEIDDHIKLEQLKSTYDFSQKDNQHLKFHVEHVDVQVAEGHLIANDFSFNKKQSLTPVNIKAKHINLSEIFKLINVEGLTAEGFVNGTLPSSYDKRGYFINNGELDAIDKGIIIYAPSNVTESFKNNKKAAIVTEVLSDFQYEKLHVMLNMKPEMTFLHGTISGKNPNFYQGLPLEFHLRLTAPFESMLDAGFIGKYIDSRYHYTVKEE